MKSTTEVNATDAKVYGEVLLYKQAKDKIENTNDHLKLFGEYLIEEIPVSHYVCTGLELVDGTRNNPNDKFKSVGLTTPTSYLIPESVRLIAGNERKTARIQAYYNTNPLRNQYNNKKLKTAKKAV